MSVATSRVFDTALDAHTRISALTFPAHPTLAASPTVTFDSSAARAMTENAEIVAVSTTVGDDATIIASGLPDRRDERVNLVITVMTAWGENDDRTVLTRLRDLCDVIQVAAWDTDQTSPTGRSKPFGANGVSTSGVTRVSFDVFTADEIAGVVGMAEIVYALHFRI